VPDELRKHYLSDGEGGQYSTNLDRNRYGNDDQYLFTGEFMVQTVMQSHWLLPAACHDQQHQLQQVLHR
jgi:hypothetical protein